MDTEFVFGYGSLAALAGHRPTRSFHRDGYVTDLEGYARGWGVAMDNRRDLPGYKSYRAPGGRRPAVAVAFLDVRACAGTQVNGVCTPVDSAQLHGLDARERNYERTEVTDMVAVARGRVWAYVGRAESRDRLTDARARGTAVIDAGYLGLVSDAFRALGPAEYERCSPSLEPDGLPVLALRRIELPG
ncbi:MAG TPA: gamma-glutamylcyclotransferase family protein [Solirubrobacteraceae bacterium]|nr:gamma-glutamylcyclotransferase family protein [Solirubrobacteraceae bacterium]